MFDLNVASRNQFILQYKNLSGALKRNYLPRSAQAQLRTFERAPKRNYVPRSAQAQLRTKSAQAQLRTFDLMDLISMQKPPSCGF